MKNPDVVIYHGPGCNDGFCAAWVYWSENPNATFIPMGYGEAHSLDYLLSQVLCKKAVMVDFSMDRESLIKLNDAADEFLVLDHHKTAKDNLEGLDFCKFSDTDSGATMAWKDVHGEDAARPMLVRYVEDRDTWRNELPNTDEINAYISSLKHTFNVWDNVYRCVHPLLDISVFVDELHIISKGSGILEYRQRIVEAACANPREVTFEGKKVFMINMSHEFASDAGHKLAEDRPFSMIYSVASDDAVKVSLRSRENGSDVSEIARKYGGGGHKHAAGFTMMIGDLDHILAGLMDQ